MLATLAIVSCENKTEAEIEEAKRLKGFNTVVIDSCEYLIKKEVAGYQGYGYFSHKGNCRFCKERKEREEGYETKRSTRENTRSTKCT